MEVGLVTYGGVKNNFGIEVDLTGQNKTLMQKMEDILPTEVSVAQKYLRRWEWEKDNSSYPFLGVMQAWRGVKQHREQYSAWVIVLGDSFSYSYGAYVLDLLYNDKTYDDGCIKNIAVFHGSIQVVEI